MSEPYMVEAVASAPSNAIRSHDHPMLESGNLSFPEGRYLLDFRPGEDRSSYVVTHRIEGAPLIDRLLECGQAQYACIVSSPISSYRRTHVSSDARHRVGWDGDDLGEPPLFTPMILCSEPRTITLDAKRDGVHRIWDNQRIDLEKGSRLALGSVIQLESSILQLLSLHEDEHLQEGQFFVDINEEPFRFRVRLSSRLHKFLRFPKDPVRNHIMTHIVTACLARLQRDYTSDDGESGWQSFRNLRAFADYLDHKGIEHWSDPDFRPEKVATALYPHVLPNEGLAGSEEGDDA